jgi:hypothetical protein
LQAEHAWSRRGARRLDFLPRDLTQCLHKVDNRGLERVSGSARVES